MSRLSIAGAGLLALSLLGCGPAGEVQDKETAAESIAATRSADNGHCSSITATLEVLLQKRGGCVPTFKNQEPFQYNPAVCEETFSSACQGADLLEVQAYTQCLDAVPTCDPAAQDAYDDAIDACLDHAQQVLVEDCIEVVIGD
ncbi:hypothetical protein ACLESO_38565 [Pyxidicoccus sp. 3LG]